MFGANTSKNKDTFVRMRILKKSHKGITVIYECICNEKLLTIDF